MNGEQTVKDELTQIRIIEGLHYEKYWYKIFEQFQSGNISLNASMEFIQQLKTTENLNRSESWQDDLVINNAYLLRGTKANCQYCEYVHKGKKKESSIWKDV